MFKRALLATVLAFPFAAQAADLPVRTQPVAPSPVPSAFSWQGFYVGGSVGFINLNTSHINDEPEKLNSRNHAFTGSIHAGYNFQRGNLVYGVEADLSLGRLNGRVKETSFNGVVPTTTFKTRLMGTVRGRLGMAFDRTLVYATGGLSMMQGRMTSDNEPDLTRYTKYGYVIGAGVEYALTNNILLRAEGLYHNYSRSITYDDGAEALRFRDAWVGRVGLSYKF